MVSILESSSDPEDGGVSPPPRKKQRITAASANMQANGCSHNGTTEPATSIVSHSNGTCSNVANGQVNGQSERGTHGKTLSKSDRDIVRLIGQHLRGLGLE